MEKEIELLSRVTVNHLFLTQFEAFRASLLSLRKRNPTLSISILQTVVAQGGKIKGVLWSDSCSSPSLLTWLSALVLLEFDDASSIWNLDPDLFKLKVEFLLLLQLVSTRVSENTRRVVDLDSIDKEDFSGSNESFEEYRPEDFVSSSDYLVDSVNMLDRISELGLRRLRRDIVSVVVESDVESVDVIKDEELQCLKNLYLEQVDVFDAICYNIRKQVHWFDQDESGLAITVHSNEKTRRDSDEELQILKLILKNFQLAHLEALKELAKGNDVSGAISHIRYLHLDHGVLDSEYNFSWQVWSCFFEQSGLPWVCPSRVMDLFSQWSFRPFSAKGRRIWSLLPFAVIWSIWLERNRRTFEGKDRNIQQVCLSSKGFLCFWARGFKECRDVFFEHVVARWVDTMF